MKKKRKFKIKYILIVMIAFYVGYVFFTQQMTMNRMNAQLKSNEEENKKIEQSNEYLRDQLEHANTDEFKEKQARERIGLIKPEETVYIINEKK